MQSLHNEAEIEQYLGRVRARLYRLPAPDQEEELAEVRNHLRDLAQAHIELGETEQEAIRAALTQFGDPKAVGTNLQRVWQKGREKALPGTLLTATGWAVGVALVLNVVHIVLQQLLPLRMVAVQGGVAHSVPTVVLGMWVLGCLQTVATGYVTGRKAPRYAFAGMVLSTTLLTSIGLVIYCKSPGFQLHPTTLPYYLRASAMSVGIGLMFQYLGVRLGRKRFLVCRQAAA